MNHIFLLKGFAQLIIMLMHVLANSDFSIRFRRKRPLKQQNKRTKDIGLTFQSVSKMFAKACSIYSIKINYPIV